MKTRFVLALTLTLSMLLVAVIPAAATEPEVYNERIDWSMTPVNSCSNELIELSGTIHTASIVVDNGNRFVWQVRTIWQLSGMSESGTPYQFVSHDNCPAMVSGTGANVGSCLYTWRLVGAGPSNNEVFYVRARYTLNANGTVTTEREEVGFACQ